MIDSHIHLSHRYFDQTFPYIRREGDGFVISSGSRDSLIAEMREQGVRCCIEPAIDADSNQRILRLCEDYPGFIHPAAGNHPTRCIRSPIRDLRRIRTFAADERIVAVGETGLDYHYPRRQQHRLRQKLWFRWQIDLAHACRLPLILHVRMAEEDALRILRRNRLKLHGGVCHCFGGGPDAARAYTEELGLCLGIGGTLLMDPEISQPLREAVRAVPMEYLLLETDGPYVRPAKPEGITGKKWMKARNTSLILPAVAEEIAKLKGVSAAEVIRVTEENTKRVFGIGG